MDFRGCLEVMEDCVGTSFRVHDLSGQCAEFPLSPSI